MGLAYEERPAAGEPSGLLVLHHGRGSDERDLLPLADALDPSRRWQVVTPRAPLTVAGAPGYHWYLVPRVGHPDADTFFSALGALSELHDELWERTGVPPERTVLGGFSMGTVMSYAAGLAPGRPAPAGILGLSGFLPTVAGWQPDLAGRTALRAFIAHGRRDPVIDVAFAREAARTLTDAGLAVEYHEGDGGHWVDPAHLPAALDWMRAILPRDG